MGFFSGRLITYGYPRKEIPTHWMRQYEAGATGTHRMSKAQLHQATRTRKTFAILSSFSFVVTVVFLILVEIGNTRIGPIFSSIYFLRLNLSNIVPQSVPNAVLPNTIAQTLGLHDYYQFGLWDFCEGYVSLGITDCSKPKALYWFNPVEILLNQLSAGVTIEIPTEVTTYLHVLRVASHWMFGLFLTSACLSFVLIFTTPLAVYSQWLTLFIVVFALLNAVFIVVATVLGSAISIIVKRELESYQELNIGANIGTKMFAFMWIASAFAIFAWFIQLCMCCCNNHGELKKRGSGKESTEGSNGASSYQQRAKHNRNGRRRSPPYQI